VRAKGLLNELKTTTKASDIVVSDDKLFPVESKINVQNARLSGKSIADLPADKRTKFRCQKPACHCLGSRFQNKEIIPNFRERMSKGEHNLLH
jgi:hypothetical protein